MNEDRPPRIYKVLIMILPIGVVIGTAVFMWMYFVKHQEKSNEQNIIVATGIRMSDLQDIVGKFTELIGPRTTETEGGRIGLRKAAAMIEGRLGPQNLGLIVRKDRGEAAHDLLFKSLWVDVRGEEKPEQVVLMAVSYAGDGEAADANAVATVMMLASSLAQEQPTHTIRIVFLPFDRAPTEQNQWLSERCILDDESCVGVIGLRAMKQTPQVGDEVWQVLASENNGKLWWNSLKNGGRVNSEMPIIWLTHPVYASQAWQDNKVGRLNATIGVTQEIRQWLLKAAE